MIRMRRGIWSSSGAKFKLLLSSALGTVKRSSNNSSFTEIQAFDFVWTTRTSNFGTTNITKSAYGGTLATPTYLISGNNGFLRSSTDGVTWTTRTTNLGTTTINALEFGNGIFLAANSLGVVKTSTDGTTWTTQPTFFSSRVDDFVYGTKWVGIGQSATFGGTSTDGVTWTTTTHGVSLATAVGYSPDTTEKYVVVGSGGLLKSSTDAVTWTTRTSNTSNQFYDVDYGGGRWVAVGASGTARTSTDAVTWATVTIAATGVIIRKIKYHDSHWYYLNESRAVFTSTDSVTWTSLPSPNAPLGANTAMTMTIGGGKVIVAGNAGAIGSSPTEKISSITHDGTTYAISGDQGRISTSTDLVTWTSRTSTFGTTNINDVAYLGKEFMPEFVSWTTVSVSADAGFIEYNGVSQSILVSPTSSVLYTSTDGLAWTTQADNTIGMIRDAAYGAGSWVIVDSNGVNIRQSTDGVTWTTRSMSMATQDVVRVAYGGGNFVAVGVSPSGGGISSSTDGITWTTRTNPLKKIDSIGAMTYGNGKYVFAGESAIMYSSTDKITWSTGTNITSAPRTLAASPSVFVAAGTAFSSAISSSTDGITWTTRTSNFGTSYINSVAYGDGVFNAVGNNGFIRNSTDGTTWTTVTANAGTTGLQTVAHNGLSGGSSLFVAAGSGGVIRTSTDGTVWATRTSNTTNALVSAAYGNSLWVAGGYGGTIRTSTDGVTAWTTRAFWTTATYILNNIEYHNGTWTASAVNNFSSPSAISFGQSTDGITWATAPTSFSYPNNLSMATRNSIKSLNGELVIPHRSGRIKTSTDALTWSTVSGVLFTTTMADLLYSVAYGGGLYAISGNGSDYATSTDLVTWTTRNVKIDSEAIGAIEYFNGEWVLFSRHSEVFTSTDAVTWTSRGLVSTVGRQATGTSIRPRYAEGYYVFPPDTRAGVFSLSTDLTTWVTKTVTGQAAGVSDINYIGTHGGNQVWIAASASTSKPSRTMRGNIDNRRFYAVGDTGSVRLSTDGTTWATATVNTTADVYGSSTFATTLVAKGLNSIAEANYVIAAVGETGNVVVSNHGADAVGTFTGKYTGALSKFVATHSNPFPQFSTAFVEHNGSQYLAAAASSPYTVMSSTDGFSWTTASTTMSGYIGDVAYGQGKWLIVGSLGRMATSTDAVTWDTVASTTWSTTTAIYTAEFGNNMWLVGGEGGQVRTSTDAVTWTTQTPGFGSQSISEMVFQSGKFLLGSNATPLLKATTDGVTWVTSFTTTFINDALSVGNGYFFLPVTGSNMRLSTDAVTWTTSSVSTTTYLARVAYGNGVWLGVQANRPITTGYDAVISTDLTTWTTIPSGSDYGNTNGAGYYNRVIYDGSKWVLFGNNLYVGGINHSENSEILSAKKIFSDTSDFAVIDSSGYPWRTSNFSSFSSAGLATPDLNPSSLSTLLVAFGNGKFASVNNNTFIRHSTDGVTWATASSSSAVVIGKVTYGNRFVAGGNSSGYIYSSTDGAVWATSVVSSLGNVGWFAYNGSNLWLAVGTYGSAAGASSTDGITWTSKTYPTTGINQVAFGNGIWMIAGTYSALRTSTDAVTWDTRSASEYSTTLSSLSFGNGVFVAQAGHSGRTISSTDGITWTRVFKPEGAAWFVGDKWINTGLSVTASHISTDLVTWTTTFPTTANRIWAFGNGIYIGRTNTYAMFTVPQGELESSFAVNDFFSDGTNKAYAADSGSVYIWNGANYAWANIGNTDNLKQITYSKTAWVVNGEVASYASTDGVTWTTIASGLTGSQVTDTIVTN